MAAMMHSLYESPHPSMEEAGFGKRNPNTKRDNFSCYPKGGRRIEVDHRILTGTSQNSRALFYHHTSFLRTDCRANAASDASAAEPTDDAGEDVDWENEIRKKLKEIEEMKELERRAEELQAGETQSSEGIGDETEEEKRQRVRKELEKVAKEQAERRETAKLMFEVGQKAYGKGNYGRAIEFLEAALTIVPRQTLFGGEIQIWLAMAYEAKNRHKECIALYQELEKKHPSLSIRRQAAGLRYILQAPKLKITEEEMVTIPLIGSSYDSYAGTWSDKYKDRGQRGYEVTTNQITSNKDYLADFMVWRPPVGWERSRAFWAYVTVCLGLLGVCLLVQK